MKYEKMVTINIGNYQSLKIGVTEAPSFDDCDKVIIEELDKLDMEINEDIKNSLRWGKE